MTPDLVLAKTEKGKEQLHERGNFPRGLRLVLILVDGHSTLAALKHKGEGLPNFEDSLRLLKEMGLIAPIGESEAPGATPASSLPVTGAGARGATLKQQLVALAENMLQDDAGKVVRKIEGSSDTHDALLATIDGCGKLIRLLIDDKKSASFVQAAKELLSKRH